MHAEKIYTVYEETLEVREVTSEKIGVPNFVYMHAFDPADNLHWWQTTKLAANVEVALATSFEINVLDWFIETDEGGTPGSRRVQDDVAPISTHAANAKGRFPIFPAAELKGPRQEFEGETMYRSHYLLIFQ